MENQRVRLSKAMMKQALMVLLSQKSIDKITIYELCARAEINRTTFYKYYGNQYDLLDEIKGDYCEELEQHLEFSGKLNPDVLERALEYISENREKWSILLNAISDREFPEKLFGLPAIRAMFAQSLPTDCTPTEAEYIMLFYCQGGYAIIRKWLSEDCRQSGPEIARLLYTLGNLLHLYRDPRIASQE